MTAQAEGAMESQFPDFGQLAADAVHWCPIDGTRIQPAGLCAEGHGARRRSAVLRELAQDLIDSGWGWLL